MYISHQYLTSIRADLQNTHILLFPCYKILNSGTKLLSYGNPRSCTETVVQKPLIDHKSLTCSQKVTTSKQPYKIRGTLPL